MSVSFLEFQKAVAALETALALEVTEIVRDATIQRFEFCMELAWKVAKKNMGTASSSPKQVIREMAQAGLICNVEDWLLAIDKRNLSVHTYNEDLAKEIYLFIKNFFPEFKILLSKF